MSEARRVAAYLESQGWPSGSRIVILSRNCAWWVMAELAIWMAGHVTVPIYTSLTVESARRLLEHCDPAACFLGPVDNADLVSAAIPPAVHCIRFPNALPGDAVEWDTIVSQSKPAPGNPLRAADDLATIIYTSGTTGTPKGVMHAFSSFPYFAKAVTQVAGANERHRILSYLPLAHIAERALVETAGIYEGWQLFFCESTATFPVDLRRARPTIFFSVPRLYAKFRSGVLEKITARKLNLLLAVPFLRRFVRKRILRELGLDNVRFAASGSAALPIELLLWFRKLGLPLSEGYGTTEAGITHTAPGGRSRPGYVGRNAPGVRTKISPAGEVLVKSPMNMLGYYRDAQGTKEAFTKDGFIRTGDLGTIAWGGWLKITGRIKEQFKTSKGKYVSPATIETMLVTHRAVETCLVMGAELDAPFAILVLSSAALNAIADREQRALLEDSLNKLLESTNAKLAPHERLKFLVLTEAKWSIEKGFLTPTLKLKRAVLEAHYARFIPEWSARSTKLVWH